MNTPLQNISPYKKNTWDKSVVKLRLSNHNCLMIEIGRYETKYKESTEFARIVDVIKSKTKFIFCFNLLLQMIKQNWDNFPSLAQIRSNYLLTYGSWIIMKSAAYLINKELIKLISSCLKFLSMWFKFTREARMLH